MAPAYPHYDEYPAYGSSSLKRHLERVMGAPLVEMRRSYNSMMWEVRAANGQRYMLSDRDAQELTGGSSERHSMWRFANPYNYSDYNSLTRNTYTDEAAAPQLTAQSIKDWVKASKMDFKVKYMGDWGADDATSKPSPVTKADKKKKTLHKLFWHRFVKDGAKAFPLPA